MKPTFYRLKRRVIEISKIAWIDLNQSVGGVVHMAGCSPRGISVSAKEMDGVCDLIESLARDGTVVALCAPDVKE